MERRRKPLDPADVSDSPFTTRTNLNAATIGYRTGTGFPSIDEGRKGKRPLYQTCSINDRMHRASGLPSGVTSRTGDTGCAGQRCPALAQHRDLER